MKAIALWGIKVYRDVISPYYAGSCRYSPTCSHYGEEAITRHGFVKGGWLTVRRVARCTPWGGNGADPVP